MHEKKFSKSITAVKSPEHDALPLQEIPLQETSLFH